jgi:hypothetical protein
LQIYKWADATYEGDMVNGVRHGWGRLSFHDSPAVYEGEWRQGLRHGKGTLWFDDARTSFYEGGGFRERQGVIAPKSGSQITAVGLSADVGTRSAAVRAPPGVAVNAGLQPH